MRSFEKLVAIFIMASMLCYLSGLAQSIDNQQAARAIAAVNHNNIQRLTNLYTTFQAAHYGPGPQNETEFKNYIADAVGPAHLKLMQVDPDNIDAVFVSERDHKPFRVKYGIRAPLAWRTPSFLKNKE